MNKHTDIVHLVISWGANVDKTGKEYNAALQIAASCHEKKEIAQALLEADADPALVHDGHQARDLTARSSLLRLIDSYDPWRCCMTIGKMDFDESLFSSSLFLSL